MVEGASNTRQQHGSMARTKRTTCCKEEEKKRNSEGEETPLHVFSLLVRSDGVIKNNMDQV